MNKSAAQTAEPTTKPLVPVQGILQRKCACGNHTMGGGECEGCSKKKSGLQRKLMIGASNDPLELEADWVADEVMAKPAHTSVSSTAPRIQRYAGQSNRQNENAPASVDQALASPGKPLEPELRWDMEQRFGHDFSRVRVHSGPAAEQSARDMSAHAYTVGHDIVFGIGRFAPRTQEGRRLIAHELTHVVQQRGGGAPPGPAQERDAEAASCAVEAGARPKVRESSGVGFAAQPEQSNVCAPVPFGLSRQDRAELTRRMQRIVALPRLAWSYTYLTGEISISRGALKQKQWGSKEDQLRDWSSRYKSDKISVSRNTLEQTQWDSEENRLLFLRAVVETELVTHWAKSWEEEQRQPSTWPSDAAVVATMVDYEVSRLKNLAEEAVPSPPLSCTRETGQLELLGITSEWGPRAAEYERREYESYLAEVARLNDLAEQESHKAIVYSGAATQGLYESYVGEPIKATAKSLLQMDTRQMVSLMVNFIPIVGQLKAVAEAIVGRDLITGEELPNWERGLNLLLAIIPEAHGIFSSGEAGLRTLARVAVDSAKPVDEVYRATKVASKLTVEEVQTVEKVVAGATPTPAQLKLAEKLEEMPGVTAKSAGKTERSAASTHIDEPAAVKAPAKGEPAKAHAGGGETTGAKPTTAGGDAAVAAKYTTPDGEVIKITKDREIWICTNPCDRFAQSYHAILEKNKDLATELERIRTIADPKAQAAELGALKLKADRAPIKELQGLATDGSYRFEVAGKAHRGNALRLHPDDWNHILEGHVKLTFDASKRGASTISTVFKGTPAQYLEILEEAVKNKAVIRELNKGNRVIVLKLRSQEWILQVDLAEGAVKTFHARPPITNKQLFDVIKAP
jgi:hypothetical protein